MEVGRRVDSRPGKKPSSLDVWTGNGEDKNGDWNEETKLLLTPEKRRCISCILTLEDTMKSQYEEVQGMSPTIKAPSSIQLRQAALCRRVKEILDETNLGGLVYAARILLLSLIRTAAEI